MNGARNQAGDLVVPRVHGRLPVGLVAALAMILSACGPSSSAVTTTTSKSTGSQPSNLSASGPSAYSPVSCSAIQSAVSGAASWDFVGQSDYDSPAQLQPIRAAGIEGVPSNTYPVAARLCGWIQSSGGPLEVYFFKWNQPLTKDAWVAASKDQVFNTPLDYENGLGSWAVGEDQALTKQDYVLMVSEGDGSWGFEVNTGDSHTITDVLPIAQAVQSLLANGKSAAATTTPSTTVTSSSAPPCNAASLATAASSYEQKKGNPDGSGSKLNAVVCAAGYAAAPYTPGNDPNTGATMAFQQSGSSWTVLGTGNILPPDLGIPPAIYAQLNQELGASPTPQSAAF